MADFLSGVGILSKFSGIIVVLLVFITVYAILKMTGTFKENEAVQFMIAFLIAGLMMFSSAAQEVIKFMAPWFVVFFFFIMFLLMSFKMFGTTDSDVLSFLKGSRYSKTVVWWIIAVGIVIGLLALSNVFGQSLLTKKTGQTGQTTTATGQAPVTGSTQGGIAGGDFQSNLWNTIYHPKVLGMILILLIGAFTIKFLSSSELS